jgi:hypothetical protein
MRVLKKKKRSGSTWAAMFSVLYLFGRLQKCAAPNTMFSFPLADGPAHAQLAQDLCV